MLSYGFHDPHYMFRIYERRGTSPYKDGGYLPLRRYFFRCEFYLSAKLVNVFTVILLANRKGQEVAVITFLCAEGDMYIQFKLIFVCWVNDLCFKHLCTCK